MFEKIKNKLEKIRKNQKNKEISLIFLEIAIDGLVLNFTVFSIFNLPFTWYGWIGWGFVPYILGEMIPKVIVKYKQRLQK